MPFKLRQHFPSLCWLTLSHRRSPWVGLPSPVWDIKATRTPKPESMQKLQFYLPTFGEGRQGSHGHSNKTNS